MNQSKLLQKILFIEVFFGAIWSMSPPILIMFDPNLTIWGWVLLINGVSLGLTGLAYAVVCQNKVIGLMALEWLAGFIYAFIVAQAPGLESLGAVTIFVITLYVTAMTGLTAALIKARGESLGLWVIFLVFCAPLVWVFRALLTAAV